MSEILPRNREKKPALSENTPAQILSMPLICTKVVAQIVQHDDRSINTKILENLIFTRYLRLTCVGSKSFLASPSQVTSHFVQVQVKSQVISLFNKSSHKSQKLRLESDSSPSHTTRVYNSAL
jgi:hypothetical protein